MLDALYASGDDAMDDGRFTAFRVDRNYQLGLLLPRRVLAWQTARARLNASDPLLSGRPAEDLDRLASDGAVFSTLAVFPQAGWRLSPSLEVYGGVLLAWTPAALVDPFNTRVRGGGVARNFLDGQPSDRTLGTELDVGARARLPIPGADGLEVMAIVEYGVLLPGGALGPEAGALDAIHGGRFTLALMPPAEAQP